MTNAFPDEYNYSNPDYLSEGFISVLSECTGAYPGGACNISTGMLNFAAGNHYDMKNLILDVVRYGGSASVKWIL